MSKTKVFISSVQTEFVNERKEVFDYINADPILSQFFKPFLFELLPATDLKVDSLYLREVEASGVYIGLFGTKYGYEDSEGVSPTEREFDCATKFKKTRLIFITNHSDNERETKEVRLIHKAEGLVIRKQFRAVDELKSSIYAALARYLESMEILRVGPFDASVNKNAKLSDLSKEKIIDFVRKAKQRRGLSLHENAPIQEILTHLNLLNNGRLINAAILLFAKQPQRFFISSEVKCASFHGIEVAKPILSYKVYKGDVFELVQQSVDFVLSKLDYLVETRKDDVEIPGGYEIPKEIVTEAIVNAIAHRDYTSNGSVQIMLFKDRLEVWNPGSLPMGWSTDTLKKLHSSLPSNPLLAEPMYLAGYIERLGTGTSDIIRIAKELHLQEPKFLQEEEFRTVIYRPKLNFSEPTLIPTVEATVEATVEVQKLVLILSKEMKRTALQDVLQINHADFFRVQYIDNAIINGFIELVFSDKPNHPKQKYRLTPKGVLLQKSLQNKTQTDHATVQATDQATDQVNLNLKQLFRAITGVMKRSEIMKKLKLNHRPNFNTQYLEPAIKNGFVELTFPDSPKHPNQKYRLTEKGLKVKNSL